MLRPLKSSHPGVCLLIGLHIGLLTATLLASVAAAHSDKLPTLKNAYKHHFYVGAAINRSIATGEPPRFGYRTQEQVNQDIALTVEQFNQISPENDLKWSSIQPREGPDGYDFGPADAYVAFGMKHHMLIVGHTLVWHGQTPQWVFAGTAPASDAANPSTNAPAPPASGVGANPASGVGANPGGGVGANPGGGVGGNPGGGVGGNPGGGVGTNPPGGGGFGRGFVFSGPRATREELLERMREHIHTVVGRYRGKIKVWDVVNEAIADGGPNILRNSLWLQIIGPDFIAKAFQYAHEADPHAILRYNDYGLENPAKRQKLITLIKELRAEKVPVMAIGTQSHVSVSFPSPEAVDQELTDLESLGLPIHITELDVNGAQGGQRGNGADINNTDVRTQGGLVNDADQLLANQYANLFKVFLKHKSVKVVTMWGVNDGVSWLARGKPLLFDSNDKPKPAFYAVIQAARGNQPDSR